ncbi:YncE family protein [Ideonella sp. 4Y11]|uniref:YncE family protein n=1 Tax=Ideonella aquatica TaxID=2824119 RepID=A0A940YQL2_9BURK|nr:YncE family protein [Ideonella aquatica]MBQ0957655.1 YncE family protein [Ideonella aquatica]
MDKRMAVAAMLAVGALASARAQYTLYVGNDQCPTNNSVTRFTGKPWGAGATVPVGHCPAGIAFSPDGATAWVMNAGANTITPIATASFSPGAAFDAGVVAPLFAAVTPDGQWLATTGAGSNQLALIATTNTALVKTVAVGASPTGLALLPDGSKAYTANVADNTVSVVSLGTQPKLKKTLSLPGCSPYGMAATPDGSAVYVACISGPLWRIRTAKDKADAAPIALPQTSGGAQVVITRDGKTAFVSNTNGAVYPVTLKTGAVGAPIAIPGAYGLALSPDGKVLAVGNGDCCWLDTPVHFIKVSTLTVETTLGTGTNYTHRWLAFQP